MKVSPLPSSFMVTSIIGMVISAMTVFQKYPTWGFTFFIVFAAMFVASLISMHYSDY